MAEKKQIAKAREQVLRILNQAKDSLRVLQTFEKETMTKARGFVPNFSEQKRLTNEKILFGLKRMGVATQDEVQALSSKIKSLESAMNKPARAKTSKSASAKA